MAESNTIRVLAVDDSLVALKVLRRALEGTEFEIVAEVRSGAEALAQYQALSPDLVLLDLVMPDMDGGEVLRDLREADPQSRIVMVSSLGTKAKVMECLQEGARSFVMKPFQREEMLQVLRQAVAEE